MMRATPWITARGRAINTIKCPLTAMILGASQRSRQKAPLGLRLVDA